MECGICFEEKYVNKCFHNCSFKVCNSCMVTLMKTHETIKYKCPQCRKETVFKFGKKFNKFCEQNINLAEKIAKKYMTYDK